MATLQHSSGHAYTGATAELLGCGLQANALAATLLDQMRDYLQRHQREWFLVQLQVNFLDVIIKGRFIIKQPKIF